MIIFNITSKLDASVAEAWVQWMQAEHIPAVMATGCFTNYRLVRLLQVDESEGPTYAVQYHAAEMADYERYSSQHAPALRTEVLNKWGDQIVSFRSLMEEVL